MRVAVDSYGGTLSWSPDPTISLATATVSSAVLASPTAERPITVTLDIPNRKCTYTVLRGEVITPGYHTVLVKLLLSAGHIETTTCQFLAYPSRSALGNARTR